jgi:hypothetical protein
VLGYSAADLLKQAGLSPPAPGPAPSAAQAAGTAATALAMQPPTPASFQPQPAPAPFQPAPPSFAQPGPAASNNAAHASTVFGGTPPPPQGASPFQPAPFQPPPPQGFPPVGQGGPSFGHALPGPIPPGAATMPPPSNPAFGPPQGGQFGGSAATAATMFMQQGPAPQAPQPAPAPAPAPFQQPYQPPQYQPPPANSYQPPQYQPPQYQPPQYQPPGMAGYSPVPVGPAAQQPPFLASQTAARLGRPVEPFYESVRLVLLAFGALLLIAFVTPISIDPLGFHWNAIASAPGKAKVPPLLIAAAGALGILMSLIPLAYVGRAALAAVLGVIPMALSLVLAPTFEWRAALTMVASITLIAGLFVRNEYRNDLLPRILVTAGVVLALIPLLVPLFGHIPLVLALKSIGAAATAAEKIGVVLQLLAILLTLLSLIAWLPGPGTAGAKILAWVLILFPILRHVVELVLAGNIGAAIKASPFTALLSPLPPVAYFAFAAIGVAAIVGKQLETR